MWRETSTIMDSPAKKIHQRKGPANGQREPRRVYPSGKTPPGTGKGEADDLKGKNDSPLSFFASSVRPSIQSALWIAPDGWTNSRPCLSPPGALASRGPLPPSIHFPARTVGHVNDLAEPS